MRGGVLALSVAALLLVGVMSGVAAAQRGGDSALVAAPQQQVVFRPLARPNPNLLPLTPEHMATAYRDPLARTVVAGARRAQNRQDSLLVNYEAVGYQRLSVGLSLGAQGRERLAFRREGAVRVQWFRNGVALVDVEGARAVVPIMDSDGVSRGANSLARRNMVSGSIQLPYYAGRDELWFGEGIPDAHQLRFVHPFADGAESRYLYGVGDSVRYTLPNGSEVRLVEVIVTPRSAEWFLVAGSFWFDRDRYNVVKAGYRPVVPMNYWEVTADAQDRRVPAVLRPFLSPMRGTVRSIEIEYALYEGEFWLPRRQVMEGEGEASIMKIPLHFEQSYDYVRVNAPVPMPTPPGVPSAGCDSSNNRSQLRRRFGGSVRVLTTVTCDVAQLVNSPSLPPSIMTDEERSAGGGGGLERIFDAGLQAQFNPRAPSLHFGLGDGLLRYNRVEGLSPALGAVQQLGGGVSLDGVARMGTGDRELNGEVGVARLGSGSEVRVAAYRRLVAANDWGEPLAIGASLQAAFFGRDEGFYYRARGVELAVTSQVRDPLLQFRLFAERHRGAEVTTRWSVARALGSDARFGWNIVADEGDVFGASLLLHHSLGRDPRGFRLLTTVKGENAIGDFRFGRGFLDVTASRGLGRVASVALSGAVGSSVGGVPVQREFMLGGTHSVRGAAPGVVSGDAFWMVRGEVGSAGVMVKPVLFMDAGWAGSRDSWKVQGEAVRSAGVGVSFFDGIVRFDLARALHPGRSWRFASYLEARL